MPTFQLPTGLTTTLEAVNAMLATIAIEPVTQLEPSQSAYADKAIVELRGADLEVQGKGMAANREINLKLTLDPDNKLPVPATTLRIAKAYCQGGFPKRLVQRGSFIYDQERHTFDFEGQPDVYVDGIFQLTFEDLPQPARTLIWAMAARRFQMHEQTSSVVDRVENQHVQQALVAFEQAEDEQETHNGIEGNWSVQGATRNHGTIRRPRG